MSISVTTAYATVPEATAYLVGNTTWSSASYQAKTDALLEARYYIDSRYSCSFDQENPPEEVKYSSSLLAADYIASGDLFYRNTATIEEKEVKAGSVSSKTVYGNNLTPTPSSIGKVDAIMSTICTVNSGGTVFLMRA